MLRGVVFKRIWMLERHPEVMSTDIFSKVYFLSREKETYNAVKHCGCKDSKDDIH